jgi:WD40 repeat protein
VVAVGFGPDGRGLLTATGSRSALPLAPSLYGIGSAFVWQIGVAQESGPVLGQDGAIEQAVFGTRGHRILIKDATNKATLWDQANGERLAGPIPHQDALGLILLSPDGKTILTVARDGTTSQLWDTATGTPLGGRVVHFAYKNDFESYVAFSSDGSRLLTRTAERTAQLWDTATGRPIGQPLHLPGTVVFVAFSRDSRLAVTVNELADETKSKVYQMRLWQADQGLPVGAVMPHGGHVWDVAFSPDGKTVLTASNSKEKRGEQGTKSGWIHGEMRLWDTATGQPRSQALEHERQVTHVAFSPDGNLFQAYGSSDVQLWDTQTHKPLGPPLAHDPPNIERAVLSPDGKVLAVHAQSSATSVDDLQTELRLWDVATRTGIGEPIRLQGWLADFAFSPDSKVLATGTTRLEAPGRLWSTATARPLGPPLIHTNTVLSLDFSPDGKKIVTASYDGTVKVWDVASGKLLVEPRRQPGPVGQVRFSSDGRRIVAAMFQPWDKFATALTACSWDATTGRPVGEPLSNVAWQWALACAPDAKGLLMGYRDGAAQLLDPATGRLLGPPLLPPGLPGAVTKQNGSAEAAHLAARPGAKPMRTAKFSPDARLVLTTTEIAQAASPAGRKPTASVKVWNVQSGRPIGPPIEGIESLWAFAVSPDGKTVLTGTRTIVPQGRQEPPGQGQLWDVMTGKPIGLPLLHQGSVDVVAFSPDGKTALTAGSDKTVRLWQTATGKPVGEVLRHPGAVRAAVFSPDATGVLTGCAGDKAMTGEACLWDARTWEPLHTAVPLPGPVTLVAFSPDGRTALAGTPGPDRQQSFGRPSGPGTFRLLDRASGQLLGPSLEHWQLACATFSPDGKTLLTGGGGSPGRSGGEAKLWDARTGAAVGTPLIHGSGVTAVAFTSNGREAWTASTDGTVRQWDAKTGQPLGAPVDRNRVLAMAAAADSQGIWLLTCTLYNDGFVRIVDALTGQPVGPPLPHEGTLSPRSSFAAEGKIAVIVNQPNSVAENQPANQIEATLWELASGKPMGRPREYPGKLALTVFSPDGRTVLVASNTLTGRPAETLGGEAHLWDTTTGEPIGRPLRHRQKINAAAFSPDCRTVVTVGDDKTAQRWDVATGEAVGAPLQHQGPILAVAFNPDGQTIVTAGRDKTARVWEAQTGAALGLPLLHGGEVLALAFRPDGAVFATGSAGGLQFWDAATRKALGPILPQPGYVSTVAFSPDGAWVLAGGADGTARLWKVPTPVEGDPAQVARWVEVLTMTQLDDHGLPQPLDRKTWQERKKLTEGERPH